MPGPEPDDSQDEARRRASTRSDTHRLEALGAAADEDSAELVAEDVDFAEEHDETSLADDTPGGPGRHREDDSPRGRAGAD